MSRLVLIVGLVVVLSSRSSYASVEVTCTETRQFIVHTIYGGDPFTYSVPLIPPRDTISDEAAIQYIMDSYAQLFIDTEEVILLTEQLRQIGCYDFSIAGLRIATGRGVHSLIRFGTPIDRLEATIDIVGAVVTVNATCPCTVRPTVRLLPPVF